MPYIPQDAREAIASGDRPSITAGELNFAFTMLINLYRGSKGDSYATFNDIMGALEGAKQEFYRRVVGPYEDTKIAANGDVY